LVKRKKRKKEKLSGSHRGKDVHKIPERGEVGTLQQRKGRTRRGWIPEAKAKKEGGKSPKLKRRRL